MVHSSLSVHLLGFLRLVFFFFCCGSSAAETFAGSTDCLTANVHSALCMTPCTWYSDAEQNAVVDDWDEAQDAFGLLQLLGFQAQLLAAIHRHIGPVDHDLGSSTGEWNGDREIFSAVARGITFSGSLLLYPPGVEGELTTFFPSKVQVTVTLCTCAIQVSYI